jgi:Glyoxalase-like domain
LVNTGNDDTGLQPGIDWVCVDADDPATLAAWWQRLVGGVVEFDADEDVMLAGPRVRLYFLKVPEAKATKNRVHFDLRATDYERAVNRALELGATKAPDVYDGKRWQVLRDPEGNEFCILRPSYEPYRSSDPEEETPG